MKREMDLESLGGDEIAKDFTAALVSVFERKQKTVMDYDLDRGVFIRITVESITKKQFERNPAKVKVYS